MKKHAFVLLSALLLSLSVQPAFAKKAAPVEEPAQAASSATPAPAGDADAAAGGEDADEPTLEAKKPGETDKSDEDTEGDEE